ncbi:hypothetical protein SASPL_150320 [Salvia splendens]|uniref:K-box domain-containing protein n=1 Tax=Salvia splendens TaxID=180675 RepID=A0A8X8W750_SALSN|nr:hypothetical protein SASPL_150320 [Salvia splendens]
MLQDTNRHLRGEGLSSLNVKELKQLESRLERGISRIRGKKEAQLEQENASLRAKILENEKLQQLSMMPGGQDFALQAYYARNMLQLNMMECGSGYDAASSDRKTVHLGY